MGLNSQDNPQKHSVDCRFVGSWVNFNYLLEGKMKFHMTTVNDIGIEFETNSMQSFIRAAAFFNSLPDTCGICGSSVRFEYRKPQGFEYYSLVCNGEVRHECNIGQHNNERKTMFCARQWVESQVGTTRERDQNYVGRQTEGQQTRQQIPPVHAAPQNSSPEQYGDRQDPEPAPAQAPPPETAQTETSEPDDDIPF